MSFSSDVKAELCRAEIGSRSSALAECYGVMLFCHTFDGRTVRIMTGSDEFAQRLPRILNRAFGLSFDEQPGKEDRGKRSFVISSRESMGLILSSYGYSSQGLVTHHVNLGLLEDDASRTSFLRGAFLAGGSVTDPRKGYHLELVTGHCMVTRELTALFLDMGFEPKLATRGTGGGNYIIYFKQSTAIEDLLTTLGAPISAMEVMSAKIEKGMTNLVNRKVNCDTANVAKTVEASGEVLDAIKKLRRAGAFDNLPDNLTSAAILREENPELSLTELAAIAEPPVSRSGLAHRLKRLVALSKAMER